MMRNKTTPNRGFAKGKASVLGLSSLILLASIILLYLYLLQDLLELDRKRQSSILKVAHKP